MEQDTAQFKRAQGVQYGGSTQPLAQRAPTRSLAVPSMGGQAEQLVDKAVQLLEKLEERVEVLIRAGLKAKIPMPGVEVPAFRHRITPTSEPIIDYLAEAFGSDVRLGRNVAVAIYRFQEVVKAIAWREPGGPRVPDNHENFRRQVFYLANLSSEFQADPILKTLFPPPQAREVNLQKLSPEERRKSEMAERNIIQTARTLYHTLTPKMQVVALTLEDLDKGLSQNLGALFSPQGRTAKMIAAALTNEPGTVQRLREAYAGFQKLKEMLTALREEGGDPQVLKPIVLPLGQLPGAFDRPPLLRDLFARRLAPAR